MGSPLVKLSTKDQQTLLQEQAYANALFMSIGEGVIATDENGNISRINPAALRILRCKEADVLGRWFPKVIFAQDEQGQPLQPIDRPIMRAFISGQPISEKMFYKTFDGNIIPVFVTVAPIVIDDMPKGAIEIFHDISYEHDIDRMKSEFISLASHQLRTPLSAITTYTHMLASGFQGEVTQGQKEFLETILASSKRMNELIDTLLNVTRLESGHIRLELTKLDVSQLVTEIKQELWPLAEAKDQQIELRGTDEPKFAHADKLLLTEVFTNLLSNAIKYTPPKGKITVTLAYKGDELSLKVKDTGYGIPKHLQEQVFTKFFRAPNILHEESVGTGLGLYMVKQIVNNLKGTIRFTSSEEKGTTFYVTLPTVERHQEAEAFRIV